MRHSMFIRFGGVVAAVAGAMVLAGCAGDKSHPGDAAGRHAHMAGMMCPKCETVWVAPEGAAGGSPKVQAMTWGRQMTCPDCDAMAKAYFKDGETVLHNCPTCNVTPRPTTPVTPTHPKGTHT